MSELLVKVNDFEGPLDLLLHLIKETKMDIQEVPMLLIVDQYLAFIHSMQTMQLDIAGDYLVMAATLLEIKSRKLLPRVEEVPIDLDYEEVVDIEENLIQQLIEYKQFKDIADLLKEKEAKRGELFAKSPSNLERLQDSVPLQAGEIQFDDLLAAFQKMFQKKIAQQPLQTTIEMEQVSVEETMEVVLTRLRYNKQEKVSLAEFVSSKATLIATFLAVLELAKSQRIQFVQEKLNGSIYLVSGSKIDEPMNLSISSAL